MKVHYSFSPNISFDSLDENIAKDKLIKGGDIVIEIYWDESEVKYKIIVMRALIDDPYTVRHLNRETKVFQCLTPVQNFKLVRRPIYINRDDREQIEQILDLEPTGVVMAHHQQYLKLLYDKCNLK